MFRSKSIKTIGLIVLAVMLVGACTPAAATPAMEAEAEEAAPAAEEAMASDEKTIIGLSFSDFATERWKNEEVLMRGLLEDKG